MSAEKSPIQFYKKVENDKHVVFVKFTHKDVTYDMPADKAGEALMAMGLFLLAALFVGMLLCQEVKEKGVLE